MGTTSNGVEMTRKQYEGTRAHAGGNEADSFITRLDAFVAEMDRRRSAGMAEPPALAVSQTVIATAAARSGAVVRYA